MAWSQPSTRSTGYKTTAANWNELVNNFLHLTEVAYVEYTASVAMSGTTVGTAGTIVSAGAITYEAVPHMIEFFCPKYTATANSGNLILKDGATVLGTLSTMANVANTGGAIFEARRITPTAASHTYTVAAWNSTISGQTFVAGTGGAAGDGTTFFPGYIRIWKVPV